MSDSISLHPKHGLNPSLVVCQYCGETTNEIVFLGNTIKNEAPRHSAISLKPCENCKKIFEQGVAIIEIKPIKNAACPKVLKYVVITEEAAKRIFAGYEHLDQVLKQHMVCVPKGFLDGVEFDD